MCVSLLKNFFREIFLRAGRYRVDGGQAAGAIGTYIGTGRLDYYAVFPYRDISPPGRARFLKRFGLKNFLRKIFTRVAKTGLDGFTSRSRFAIFGYMNYDTVYMVTGIIPYSGGGRCVIAVYLDRDCAIARANKERTDDYYIDISIDEYDVDG